LTIVRTLRKTREIYQNLSFLTEGSIFVMVFIQGTQNFDPLHCQEGEKCLAAVYHASEQTKKPQIIHFYSSTEGGIDCFDELVHNYSVAQNTLMVTSGECLMGC
jgi:hypothetical protein